MGRNFSEANINPRPAPGPAADLDDLTRLEREYRANGLAGPILLLGVSVPVALLGSDDFDVSLVRRDSDAIYTFSFLLFGLFELILLFVFFEFALLVPKT